MTMAVRMRMNMRMSVSMMVLMVSRMLVMRGVLAPVMMMVVAAVSMLMWLMAKYARAAVDGDTALGIDLNVGRASQPRDLSFAYGYGETEVDAVLAAFSHDNYSFATNYMAHELGVSYVLTDNVSLAASLYHYKPLTSAYAGTSMPDEWLDRIRLNLAISY